ncbi:ATP-binding cassette domain-containing protein [Nocardioides panacisoli]|uniref:ABC transporter ATP-binding protein n=1 Tax=Nocardioides panacisoli TaxID=627624 RepID=UPI001C63849B|nr:ABC transporter ATP-binding protein [Nocardioides panacisoli]QYJ04458.1 ATP-binding cassette domain-containing protein [Nocardioides panacisoli]
MIELRDITLRHEDRTVLDGVDLTVESGELMLLAGPTGVGKSTLLGVVAGLVPGFTGGTLTGDVRLDGESIIERPARDRAHAIGFVGQNPAAWFVTDTVEEELAFGMEQLGLPPTTMRRRVEETLDLLGIADLRDRDLRTLSGGQQQRVAIGAVLAAHPRLLVLDEPTSALDPTAAEEVLATLTRLVHDLGLTVLVAEHRLERVMPFADRMCLLDRDGRARVGEPAEVLRDAPIAPPLVELGRLAEWHPLPLTVRDARRRTTALRSHLGLPPSGPPVTGTAVATTRGLVVARGGVPVLRGLDLDLAAGSVTALMGRNGAGKSTLLWALQGRFGTTEGRVDVAGSDPHAARAEQRRELVGMVPQSPADLLYLETVAEECATADRTAEAAPGSCRDLLDRLAPGIDTAMHPRDLSEGQRLALAVAIVLTARPPVLLLDEPTRGLDYPAKRVLARILRDLADRGRAVLVATHDVEFVAQSADRVAVLAEGEVVSSGPVRDVVAESPAFAPQVTKVLGPGWLTVGEVADALGIERAADEVRR